MEVSVPDLGDFADVEIIEVLVKAGDRIAPEDPIVTLETDKATMDVPAPAAGVVGEVKVAVGDRVSTGDPLITLDTDGANFEAPAPAAPRAEEAGAAGAAGKARRGESTAASTASADGGGAGGNGGAKAASAQAAGATKSAAKPAEPAEPAAAAPAAAGAASSGAERMVTVPDLGDFSDVEVIEVLVEEGDEVEAEQALMTLETEKATMDVPAPEAGTIVSLRVKVGDRVSAGDEIMVLRSRISTTGAAAPGLEPSAGTPAERAARQGSAAPAERAARQGSAAAAKPPAAEPPAVRPIGAAIDEAGFARVHASPSVRKLARELGVDLGRVRGSGRKGRVTADDVKSYVKEIMRGARPAEPALPPVPQVDFAKFGAIDVRPLGRIQRISGARVHASWVNIPHVTQHDEADITALEETRRSLKAEAEQRGIKLTPLAFVMRACALMLAELPKFKSSLGADGESLVFKEYTHIGFAADTPNGLVVPVIRDADKKDVYELASDLGRLSALARSGKLKADDIQGGVFTISSLGGIGGRFFTPIVNAPEVAILGVSRHAWQPVYRAGEFVPRLMLPLSLSYDHRVIDGADAVRFTTRLAETLGQVERLLEAVP
ncbi:MAG TPA: dihydrolipoyllysine-residue acetyltransferase [Gammaproteobacteria bacterium]|nr:dihydrolipoyllysine-residue acetyltransferase [Gammaproteobacteria bacterium]